MLKLAALEVLEKFSYTLSPPPFRFKRASSLLNRSILVHLISARTKKVAIQNAMQIDFTQEVHFVIFVENYVTIFIQLSFLIRLSSSLSGAV